MCRTFGQGVNWCERACGRVVGGRHFNAVDIQVGCRARGHCADVQSWLGVVRLCRRAAWALHRAFVVVVAGRCRWLGRRCGVYRDVQRRAGLAFVACWVGQGVGEGVCAFRDRIHWCERAGGCVVGRWHFDAVHIQAGRVAQARRDFDARGGVVRARRCAGVRDHAAHVVHILCGRQRGGWCRGVDGQVQRSALVAFVAGVAHVGHGQYPCAFGQRAVGRQGAGGRVVGGGSFHAVHIELGALNARGQRTDVDSGLAVVCGGRCAGGAADAAHVVVVRCGCARCGRQQRRINCECQGAAGRAFVARLVHQGVAQVVLSCIQRVVGRQGTSGRVIGGCGQHPVHVQPGGGARGHCANVEPRCGVVGDCRCAGGVLQGADVVVVARGCCRRCRGGGVDGEHQGAAWLAFVACRVGQRVGEALRPFGQCAGGREGACNRVVGGWHFGAVDVQAGCGACGHGADVDARCGVVGLRCCAGGVLYRRGVVVVAGGRSRCGRRCDVNGQVQRPALVAFVTRGAHVRHGQCACPFGQRVVGREGACAGVVGGFYSHTVHVQPRALYAAWQRSDVHAWRAVVGLWGRTGVVLHRRDVVHVGRGCAGCGGQARCVDAQLQRSAAWAFVACLVNQCVAQAVWACIQRNGRGQGACSRVVGRGHGHTVYIQPGGGACWHHPDVQARCGVVCGGRCAVGVLYASHVVVVVRGCGGGVRRCGVDGELQRRTLGAHVARRIGVRVGELVLAFCHCSVGGQGARCGVVRRRHSHAVHKQHHAAHALWQGADIDARCGVVGDGFCAGGTLYRRHVVVVAGGCSW